MLNIHITFISVAICILIIILNETKRKRTKEIMDITFVRDLNYYLYLCVAWSILALISFWVFSGGYIDYYSFFIPEYFDRWYYLFSYKHLLEIESQLLMDKENMYLELSKIYVFKAGLGTFYNGIIFTSLAGLNLYFGIKKTGLCSDGLIVMMNKYKWNEINGYAWEESMKKTYKKYPEYHKLAVYRTNGKFEKWLMNKENTKIMIKIKSIDKEKVDNILKEKINNITS